MRRLAGCSDRCRDELLMLHQRLERVTVHHPESHEHYGMALARGRDVTVVRTGPLVIDTRQMMLTVRGALVAVPYREWQILELLALQVGTMVKREDILHALFPGERGFGNVRTVLGRLRDRLGEARRLIVTMPGIGVMLLDAPSDGAIGEGE